MINKNTLYISAILFIEGFVSLAYQMLYIRQMTPFVGNSVEVVSWIVGVFLIALALGYKIGGSPSVSIEKRLLKNFYLSSILGGFFLSFVFLDVYFKALSGLISPYYIMILYCFLIVAPITFLLGQTIPLMTNYLKGNSVSEISGNVLFLSTIGSFLGAIITTNVILKYLGVSFTIFICSSFILLLTILLSKSKLKAIGISLLISSIIYVVNINYEKNNYIGTNQYASYEVLRYIKSNITIFKSNHSNSSMLVNGEKFGYLKILDTILFKEMKLKNKNILVIGAGGFLASKDVANNQFTYIDIDPAIKDLAEKYFLGHPINGKFIAEDGRSYVNTTKETYDVVLLDAFLSEKSIPEHLSTREYFLSVKKIIKDSGLFVVNVIGRVDFNDTYTQNTYKTITSVFPYCYVVSNDYGQKIANTQFICQNIEDKGKIYTDNKNNSNSDFNNLSH